MEAKSGNGRVKNLVLYNMEGNFPVLQACYEIKIRVDLSSSFSSTSDRELTLGFCTLGTHPYPRLPSWEPL